MLEAHVAHQRAVRQKVFTIFTVHVAEDTTSKVQLVGTAKRGRGQDHAHQNCAGTN